MSQTYSTLVQKLLLLMVMLHTLLGFSTTKIEKTSITTGIPKYCLAFNGTNSYLKTNNRINHINQLTVSAWIDLDSSFSNDGVILSQNKVVYKINRHQKLELTLNSTQFTSQVILEKSRWYQIGFIYGNNQVQFLINGRVCDTFYYPTATIEDTSDLYIGKSLANNDFFKGKLDEIRIFNQALSLDVYQKIVYQELDSSETILKGKTIAKPINNLESKSLLGYFDFNTIENTNLFNNLTANAKNQFVSTNNLPQYQPQEAPLPFQTIQNGSFVSSIDNPSTHIRGLDVAATTWAIINVNHDIVETANHIDSGLIINSNASVTMANDTKLQNNWYLKIDGKLDLKNRSQLIQTSESEFDQTSIGFIERDQKGQSNLYNYNYWSSPVSAMQNYGSYTIAEVMKDGTNPTAQNIQWTSGFNSIETTPITLSNYWIYKFQNLSANYANWTQVGENGILTVGQGYTLKGSGSDNNFQNYTFKGKPNNGIFTSFVGPNNLNLSGNPYPSSLDAQKFIKDNLNSINGTLYFWENYNTNETHNLSEYNGGYATFSLVGGTASVVASENESSTIASKIPGRFIPVGQGFFVKGSATGGTITFNNNQRIFIKETNAFSNSLLRTNQSILLATNTDYYNQEDDFTEELFSKIRLGYTTSNGYHKQILLGFMNQYATTGIDNGYDAETIDNQPIDLYFINSSKKLTIQGDTYFNNQSIFPIGIKTAVSGTVKFKIDQFENFDGTQPVYIHDNVTNQWHNISSEPFELEMSIGTFDNRFSLRFYNPNALNTSQNQLANNIIIAFDSVLNNISITNLSNNILIEKVQLYNLLGQKITQWNVDSINQSTIKFNTSEMSTGTYIVKVMTDNGVVTKKILIK